jgi:hypothetical protein
MVSDLCGTAVELIELCGVLHDLIAFRIRVLGFRLRIRHTDVIRATERNGNRSKSRIRTEL